MKRILTVGIILILISLPIVSAVQPYPAGFRDSFETPNDISTTYNTIYSGSVHATHTFVVTNSTATNGSRSLYSEVDDTTNWAGLSTNSNYTMTVDPTQSTVITWDWRMDNKPQSASYRVGFYPNTTTAFAGTNDSFVQMRSPFSGSDTWRFGGDTIWSGVNSTTNDIPDASWHSYKMVFDWPNGKGYFYKDGNLTLTENITGTPRTDTKYHLYYAQKAGFDGGSHIPSVSYVDNITVRSNNLAGSKLSIDIDRWVEPNSTQPYRVYFNQSYTDGSFKKIDVTTNTTVTGNSTLLTFNNSSKTVTAHQYGGTANVTFSYQGHTKNASVVIATRTINNIGIVPPSQYIGTFLGLDESGTVAGIGSSIEWLYLAIALGAFVSWQSRNEWLGVGTITVLVILFWVLGHVSLGVTMISTFFGLFALYQLQGIPSRSDTNVNP